MIGFPIAWYYTVAQVSMGSQRHTSRLKVERGGKATWNQRFTFVSPTPCVHTLSTRAFMAVRHVLGYVHPSRSGLAPNPVTYLTLHT